MRQQGKVRVAIKPLGTKLYFSGCILMPDTRRVTPEKGRLQNQTVVLHRDLQLDFV